MRSVDDGVGYLDELIEQAPDGRPPKPPEVATDASPIARAAVEDTTEVTTLQSIIERSGGRACDVVSLVDATAKPIGAAVAPVTLTQEQQSGIYYDAAQRGVPEPESEGVVETALGMAQSTWVEASGKACTAAQQF
ncbi:MAG TPA: hypothetical protein VGV57_12710 [Thermoleophilaceae bacterium]|nr:hypothetical protein [Thermoleophilaceae bacterium]